MNFVASAIYFSTLFSYASSVHIRGSESTARNVRAKREKEAQDVREGSCGGDTISFDEFARRHRRKYHQGTQEYEVRKALFEKHVEEVREHNCRPGKRFWSAGVTPLSDRSDEELARLRGRRSSGNHGHPVFGGLESKSRLSALEGRAEVVRKQGSSRINAYPDSYNWTHLQACKEITDQGSCGSCWASATALLLRAHTDIYGVDRKFSVQQLVACVPNPEACGGSGGCNGSTGELALDYVMHNGLALDSELPYEDGDSACPARMAARHSEPIPQPTSSYTDNSSLLQERPSLSFGMLGWSKLPVNELEPLYLALYQEGPVAVSVVAGNSWNMYTQGIMNDCRKEDMVVNHLVVAIGYGDDPTIGAKYWLIQNSWGEYWGENGHMRMIRQEDDVEKEHCSWDTDPLIGTGCIGGPPKVWACGSCGILFDSVVVHFHGTGDLAQEMIRRRNSTDEALVP